MWRPLLALLLSASAALLSVSPASAAAPPADGCPGLVSREGVAMGTRVAVRICPVPGADAPRDADAALAEFDRLNALWSPWLPTSDVARINAAAGGPAVGVAPETFALLVRSVRGSVETSGLFDITFAPMGELWRFDTPPGSHEPVRLDRVPTTAEVAERLGRVGYQGLVLDAAARTARLAHKGMAIGLGGIGKGAGVDIAVAGLRKAGYSSFAVQAGGDLYCAGTNGHRPWRVGIAHPRNKGEVIGAIDVSDAAFSTSGDYERFALIDGVRYHHIIDLRTGYPATASQSATVLAPSATDAEVLTKTAFILGGPAGLSLVEKLGSKAVLVQPDGKVLWSATLPKAWEPK